MPYADPTEQKAYNLALYLRRYQSDPEFREAEAFRKKRWYDKNQALITWAYRKKRKKIRTASNPVRSGQVKADPRILVLTGQQEFPVLF